MFDLFCIGRRCHYISVAITSVAISVAITLATLGYFFFEATIDFLKNFENILKQAGGHLTLPSRVTWCLRAHG